MKDVEFAFLGQVSPISWILLIGVAALLAFVAKLILKFVDGILAKIARKTHGKVDDILFACIEATRRWALFFWILNPLVRLLAKSPEADRLMNPLTIVATALQVGIWGRCAIQGWQTQYIAPRIVKDASSASAMNLLVTSVKALFLIAVLLICLSNLGIDIGALVTGLGVGGIAVALAAQNILGDLFASLSIVLDKPFVIGDYIVVGNDQGTVENIGIKTTRVRSLSGEELIFSNKDLLESRIKNYKRMWERRVVLGFGVPFNTELARVQEIPRWIETYVKEESMLRFERSHLSQIAKDALMFEAVFWVTDPDYNKYMDLQQGLILKLLRKFQSEGVRFALPIQVVKMEAGELKAPELNAPELNAKESQVHEPEVQGAKDNQSLPITR